MAMQLKQIKFDEEDLKAVAAIQQIYGCESFSQAVRLAARIVASRGRTEFPLPPTPKHAIKRQFKSLRGIVRLNSEEQAEQIDEALRRAKQKMQLETLEEWRVDGDGTLEFDPYHHHGLATS